jgi:hypothetical protein
MKPIHHGRLRVEHRERRSLRNMPRKCGGRIAILCRSCLFTRINVLIRQVKRIRGRVGDIVVGVLAPGRGGLLLQVLLLLTPPHLLELERDAKP